MIRRKKGVEKKRAKQAQVTMEYTIIIGFLIALTIGIFTALSMRLSQVDQDLKQNNLKYLQRLILDDVDRARVVEDGYTRIIQLPKVYGGYNYSLTFDNDQILTVRYRGLEDYAFINATGNICIASPQSSFNVLLQKKNLRIIFESCPECKGDFMSFTECNATAAKNKCGRLSPTNKTSCCLNHCRCC